MLLRAKMTKSSVFRGALAASLFLLAGCSLKQDMALQPKNRPLSPSDFFTDGRSARPLVENTVARGSLLDDALIVSKDSNAFPLPLNLELLERGENRYKETINARSEEHTSELQSPDHLVCRLLLEKKKKKNKRIVIYRY